LAATGTLDLGGSQIAASFPARGLQSDGLDTVIAHPPLPHSGKQRADSLRLDGVPVVTLPERDV
jgi:hypothetical protein